MSGHGLRCGWETVEWTATRVFVIRVEGWMRVGEGRMGGGAGGSLASARRHARRRFGLREARGPCGRSSQPARAKTHRTTNKWANLLLMKEKAGADAGFNRYQWKRFMTLHGASRECFRRKNFGLPASKAPCEANTSCRIFAEQIHSPPRFPPSLNQLQLHQKLGGGKKFECVRWEGKKTRES